MFTCVIHPSLPPEAGPSFIPFLSPLRRTSSALLCFAFLLACFCCSFGCSSASQPWRPPMARVSSTSTSSRTTMSTVPSPAPSSLPIPIPIPPLSSSSRRMRPSPRSPNCTTSLLPPLPAIHSSRVPPPPHSFICQLVSRSFCFPVLGAITPAYLFVRSLE